MNLPGAYTIKLKFELRGTKNVSELIALDLVLFHLFLWQTFSMPSIANILPVTRVS